MRGMDKVLVETDILSVGATALVHGLVVATANVRLENWREG
jgi:predicted nucleic acid-binding protein